MVFDHSGHVVSVAQKEHEQIYPEAGLGRARRRGDLGALPGGARRGAGEGRRQRVTTSPRSGITNQRETALVWDRNTGEPVTTRSSGRTRAPTSSSMSCRPTAVRTASARRSACRWRPTSRGRRSGGSLTTSTAPARRPRPATSCSATWTPGCIWNLTGGTNGGLHITDVTNASRTMLMDLKTLSWDDGDRVDDRRADVDAARDPAPRARSTARSRPAPDRRRGRGRPGRPAGGDVRPGLLRRRPGQEHLRHGQLHADQHRAPRPCSRSRAC